MKKNVCFVFCFALLLLAGCQSDDSPDVRVDTTPHLNVSDSLALVKVYSTIGPWNSKWNLDDITTWDGVTTALDESTNELRVIGLEAYNGFGFHDQIPAEIGQLTELRILVLAGGHLCGSIPKEIGELKKLERLSFGTNDMTGGIPESIGNLIHLKRLDIIHTKLSDTIPESIGNLVNLSWLYLSDNQLSGNVPKGLANLTKLKQAYFDHNHLTGEFPLDILLDKSEAFLYDFSDNDIELLSFDVWKDDFKGYPPILKRNRLTGEIPQWVLKSKRWKEYASVCISTQQDGYGYSNYTSE